MVKVMVRVMHAAGGLLSSLNIPFPDDTGMLSNCALINVLVSGQKDVQEEGLVFLSFGSLVFLYSQLRGGG